MILDPLKSFAPDQEGRFVDPSGTRVLIGILAFDKYQERLDGICNSWLKLLPPGYRLLFLHGRPGQPASLESRSVT